MAKEIILHTVPIVSEKTLQRVVDDFEQECRIHVNIQWIAWEYYRQEFTNIALHRLPADVLIAGTPVTSDLIAMSVLRPFTRAEISGLGGEEAFLPSRWRSGMRPGEYDVWAIPIVTDLRLLYYNRKLLSKAGISETEAFNRPQQLEETIQRLHASGVEAPWYLVSDHFAVLHRVASWIWAYGGDLFSPDGKRVIFNEKEALDGMRAYFRLVPYVPAFVTGPDIQAMIRSGRAAVVIENPFLLFSNVPPAIGCAPVPGGSYVGGSDMMVWNHSRNESAALEFVNYLSRPEVFAQFVPKPGTRLSNDLSYYLPTRMSQLNELAASSNPLAKSMIQSVLTGRTFPCVPMIGLIEDRLGSALASIQQEILANPKTDVEQLLQQRIVSMGKRINITLGNNA